MKHALDPLVYEPGPHNEEDTEQWKLRPWAEIVDLKIVDPACGSGAMLVSACRYLADRVVEAWYAGDVAGGVPLPLPGAEGAPLVLSTEPEEWTVEAMRLVAGRCLYGSTSTTWLSKCASCRSGLSPSPKARRSFLDHSIRHGDSLIGITDLTELNQIGADGSGTQSLLLERLRSVGDQARDKRLDLLAMPTVDSRDLEEKGRLLAEADRDLVAVTEVADALTGALLSTADGNATDRTTRMAGLADQVSAAFDRVAKGDTDDGGLGQRALYWLDEGRPPMASARVPLHWPLTFPEVFEGGRGRFDATVSNPPFLGGQKLTAAFDNVSPTIDQRGQSADLVAYFFLRGAPRSKHRLCCDEHRRSGRHQ